MTLSSGIHCASQSRDLLHARSKQKSIGASLVAWDDDSSNQWQILPPLQCIYLQFLLVLAMYVGAEFDIHAIILTKE